MSNETRTVEILQGNETLRDLMSTVLSEAGLLPSLPDEEGNTTTESALLVADVDSGLRDLDSRIQFYREQEKPVLLCGLRISRERFDDGENWVERPFALGTFVIECLNLLGVEPEERTAPSLLFPEHVPVTQEADYDEMQVLEELSDGLAGDSSELDNVDDIEEFELDEDSSMVLAVEDIRAAFGGEVLGKVEKRRVDTSEIRLLRQSDVIEVGWRTPSINQTMPDTPMTINSDDDNTSSLNEPTGLRESSSFPIVADATTRSQLTTQVRGVARMLAQSWQRIALTARTEDRADRIERVLVAAVNDGLRGASEEVQRIPPASGFAGGLQAMTLIDVLRTVRDRRLRGRLELAIGDDAYVLYCDSVYLDDIDVLTGSTDHVLLDILFQGGAIEEHEYEDFRRRYLAGEIFDLEMTLASQNVVSESALQSARAVRAREVFRHICGTRGGQFAFLEVRHGDGQSWPIDALRINVDELLLQILREASIDTGDSKATARTKLVTDPTRAANMSGEQLTQLEQSVLMFFRQGDTLGEARQRLEKLAGKEAVDKIVDRLKKLELLRRSEPSIPAPQIDENKKTGKHESKGPQTVVSEVPENISDVERKHRSPTKVAESFEVGIDESQYDDPTVDRPETQLPSLGDEESEN